MHRGGLPLSPQPDGAQSDGLGPARRTRLIALTLTLVAHGAGLALLLWSFAPALVPAASLQAPLQVTLLPKPPAPPSPVPDENAAADFVTPDTPHLAPPVMKVAAAPVIDNSDLLSDSQLAGAARAGEGGGGVCDLGLKVQDALRRDRLVHAAVTEAGRQGKAILVWNGDWVRAGGQEGKGLSAAREAISWAVAFAPEACRNQRMHGLLLLTLNEDGTRFAVGTGDWRWTDLLGVRR